VSELKEVTRMEKGVDAQLVFSLTRFRGRLYFDIREFVKRENYEGYTKKGIRLDVEFYKDFKKAIDSLAPAIDAEQEA